MEAVVNDESCEIGHSHVPHGTSGGDEKNEEVRAL
jgi:hypothetical protein